MCPLRAVLAPFSKLGVDVVSDLLAQRAALGAYRDAADAFLLEKVLPKSMALHFLGANYSSLFHVPTHRWALPPGGTA